MFSLSAIILGQCMKTCLQYVHSILIDQSVKSDSCDKFLLQKVTVQILKNKKKNT